MYKYLNYNEIQKYNRRSYFEKIIKQAFKYLLVL